MATTVTDIGVNLEVQRPNVPDFSKYLTGCGGCPASVIATLSARVQISLNQVLAAQRLATEFSNLWTMVDADLIAHVNVVVGGLPDIPYPDLTEIVGFWTCPLTPLALALIFYDLGPADALAKLQAMDPRMAMAQIKKFIAEYIKAIRLSYEIDLMSSSKNNVIQLIRKMVEELLRLKFDAEAFAVATLIVATVHATCPSQYEGSIFQRFEQAVENFSLSSDLPTSLNQQVAIVATSLLLAEAKFDFMNEVISGPIPFPTLPEIPFIGPLLS